MANAVHGQRQRRVIGRRRQRQRVRMRRHDRLDRLVERGAGQHDAFQDVRLREDADRLLLIIDDDHRTNRARRHRLDDAAHRRSAADGNRRPFDHRGERRIHRLLLGDALRELRLQLLPRLTEQTGDVLRAKQVEDRALLQQEEEIGNRQFVTEDVADRRIDIGRRPLRHRRTNREALARPQRQHLLAERQIAGRPGNDLAALQDAEDGNDPGLGGDDLRFLRVIGELHALGEKTQRVGFHAIERRERLQELDRRGDQHFACAIDHRSYPFPCACPFRVSACNKLWRCRVVGGSTAHRTFPPQKWSGRHTVCAGPKCGLLVPLGTTNRVEDCRQPGKQTTPSSSHPIKTF